MKAPRISIAQAHLLPLCGYRYRQVINFQTGNLHVHTPIGRPNDCLWFNRGTRVPECAEHTFQQDTPVKKYYHEYECSIHCRLGALIDGKTHIII